MKYPTWRTVDTNTYATVEACDGVPDYVAVRDAKTKLWHIKSRTSEHWEGRTFRCKAEIRAYTFSL